MIDIAQLQVGQKVHYQPEHYSEEEWENGLIKEIRDGRNDGVWVVYNCAGNWDKYRDYTSALTHLRDLKLGWMSRCGGCGNLIDPDTCGCCDSIKNHGYGDGGHSPIPLGCDCAREAAVTSPPSRS